MASLARQSGLSMRQAWLISRLLLAFTVLALLGTCSPPVSRLHAVRTAGELRMATVNSATTYFISADGPAGYEYDLASLFAEHLGVSLKVLVVDNLQLAMEAVLNGQAHFAAGVMRSSGTQPGLRFTQSYANIAQEIVYRSGNRRPRSLEDLDGKLFVAGNGGVAELVHRAAPGLALNQVPDSNTEALLFSIAQGEIDYAVADSNLVKLNQRYYTGLRKAFSLDEKAEMAWAFASDSAEGDPLFRSVNRFLTELRGSRRLRTIEDRYFGHLEYLGFVGGKTFARQVEVRLPKFRDAFQKAGRKNAVDWRLLAAIGYQESHWDPQAVSYTQVKGLMMLTKDTAADLGVSDRRNALQSINAGSRYFAALHRRLEGLQGELAEPDRTWMALAAYNQGMGHLMDARRLTAKRGGNPDLWVDVRNTFPLLTQEKYYRQTRYGYTRGQEAVAYVGNIRAYYDILLWMTSDTPMEMPETLTEKAPLPPGERALHINTPVL
jgi:membrane-bound lytic murein transglycosylase F